MTVNQEKRKAIAEKIKALMLKTEANGCTEAEALSASEVVGRLMSEYDLDMSEVEYQQEKYETRKITTDSKVGDHMYNLINTIGKYTDVKVWFQRRPNCIIYSFYGMTKDLEVAMYLYNLLDNAVKNAKRNYIKSTDYALDPAPGKTKSTTFTYGMTTRLRQRLNELKTQFAQSNNQERGLMKVNKMAIVESQYKIDVNIKLKTVKSSATYNPNANSFSHGVNAGNKVNINSGLNGSSKNNYARLN